MERERERVLDATTESSSMLTSPCSVLRVPAMGRRLCTECHVSKNSKHGCVISYFPVRLSDPGNAGQNGKNVRFHAGS